MPIPLTVVSRSSPRLAVAAGLLDLTDCAAMIKVARTRGLQRSRVGEGSHSKIRTSDGVFLDAVDGVGNAPANVALRSRVAALVGVPSSEHLEPTQVLRYRPGQRYRPHRDTISAARGLDAGGQRFASVVVSLNDPPDTVASDTAGTRFPLAGNLTVRPAAGGAAVFYLATRINASGAIVDDPAALHEGRPTTGWTRYVAVLWAHPFPYLLPDE